MRCDLIGFILSSAWDGNGCAGVKVGLGRQNFNRRKQTEPQAALVGSLIQLFPGILASKQTGKREKSPLAVLNLKPSPVAQREEKAEVGRAPALPGHTQGDTCSGGRVLPHSLGGTEPLGALRGTDLLERD